ncbi:MAG: glycosyltransferase family 2 protein [Cyclobacteriaceae bacterium]
MRTEGNPIKQNPALKGGYKRHRIIMPVYIPNHEGYYKDAFAIFELCLQSLIDTTDRAHVNISIINNASVPEVDELVKGKLATGEVDQYVYNQVNRGKADAIVGLAKASYEPFITIADADVLFGSNWLYEIEKVIYDFPLAGAVSPFPAPNLKFTFTSSVWISNFFTIKRAKVVSDHDLLKFEESLGISGFFKQEDIKQQYYLKGKLTKAIVGSGHFVCTYRRDIFCFLDFKPTKMGLKGGLKIIDENVDRLAFWRLSVLAPKVYHMGNVLNSKSIELFLSVETGEKFSGEISEEIKISFLRYTPYFLRKKVIFLILIIKKIGLR